MVELGPTPAFAAAPHERPGLAITVEPPRGYLKVQVRNAAGATALAAVLGFDVPPPGRSDVREATGCCSVAPGEWLVSIEPEAAVPGWFVAISAALRDDVVLVTDVSAALVLLHVAGADAAAVLAASCPLDLHVSVFPPGSAARSRFGETVALIIRPSAALAYNLIIDQTAADYVWRQLLSSGPSAQ